MGKNIISRPIFILAMSLVIANALVNVYADINNEYGWTIGDEMDGYEFENHRRILANDTSNSTTNSTTDTVKFISYAALLVNSIPCSVPGASYYNCKPGAEANPYTRSCSEITRCARE